MDKLSKIIIGDIICNICLALILVCQLVFIALKLLNIITWSWWLVCIPALFLGGSIVLIVMTFLVAFIYACICELIERSRENNGRIL